MRTVWTNAEKAAVREALVQILFVNPDRDRKRALAEAQEKLPMNRRLKITDQRVFNYKALIAEARAEAVRKRGEKAKELAPPSTPVAPVIDPHSIGTLFELLVDRIVDQVYEKVNARLKKDYGQEIDRQFDAEYARENAKMRQGLADAGSLTERKPIALVIGLLAQQANVVRAQFANDPIELRFFDAEEAKASRQWPRVDRIYLMTKWVSHSVQNKVHAANTPHTLVNGNVTELTRIINCHLNQKVGHPC